MSLAERFFVSWAIDAVALALAAWIFSGVYGSTVAIIVAALVFGLLSAFVKPALKLLTFLLALVTLGIAWFAVAMFILWLTSAIVGGFHIHGFWTLVGATLVVWAVSAAADHWLFPKRRNGQQHARFVRA
jgi:putative membrane protein